MSKQGVDGTKRRLTQHKDRPRDARTAQLDTLGNRGNRKLVGACGVHGLCALDGTVTVRVGLDGTHQLGTWLEKRLERTDVGAKRAKVYLDPSPPIIRAVLKHVASRHHILHRCHRLLL